MYVLDVAIAFIVVTFFVVALRLYTRFYFVYTPGWDDLLIIISLICDFTFFGFLIVEINYGLGQPEGTLGPDELRSQLKALWITIPLYNLSLNLTKVSVILLYMRLFPMRSYQIILKVALVIVVITGLWMVLSAFFFCVPVNGFWDPTVEQHCLPKPVVWCLNAAIQITTDLSIVILPMPVLTKLRLPKRQKFALILVFALGLFVCATSIVRLGALIRLVKSADNTKDNAAAAMWSLIETNVAIICACLPPLRPLLAHLFPHLLPPRVRSSYEEREKNQWNALNNCTFHFENTNYSASVTGNSQERSTHRHPEAEGIQVISELRLDSVSVHSLSRADTHSQSSPDSLVHDPIPEK